MAEIHIREALQRVNQAKKFLESELENYGKAVVTTALVKLRATRLGKKMEFEYDFGMGISTFFCLIDGKREFLDEHHIWRYDHLETLGVTEEQAVMDADFHNELRELRRIAKEAIGLLTDVNESFFGTEGLTKITTMDLRGIK